MDKGLRTALLIGVGDTAAATHRFPSLADAVSADLRELGAAFQGADYDVHILRDPTRNEITDRIAGIARESSPGSTLVLHFTGHGVRIGDTDYLVPADARAPFDNDPAAWAQPHIRESLLDADVSKYLAGCAAGTVLWMIDACRSPEDGGPTVFGSAVTQGPPSVGFAVLMGCRPGQRSGYTTDGSFFTRALAEAFHPLTEATTVEDVYTTVSRRTRQLAQQCQAGPQDVQIHYGRDLEKETRATVVAPGRRMVDSWREAVGESVLWARVPESDVDLVPGLQKQLVALALETGRQVHLAQKRLFDSWVDDEFPVRLLRDRLPQLLSEDVELSALEVTALIAGVFLHEAAWAERLSQAYEIHPHLVSHLSDGDDLRQQYEHILKQHQQITQKLTGRYHRRDDPLDERHIVMMWLVHRWIADRFETEDQPVSAVRAAEFGARLLGGDPRASDGRLGGRLGELTAALQLVAAGLALGAPSDNQMRALPDQHALPGGPRQLRVRPLAALLRLAGLLAFDARTLPDVLAEHLAVSDAVLPREVVSVLRDAVWIFDDDRIRVRSLHLDALCPHPAVHAALKAVVEEADELGHALREMARGLAAPEAALLTGLPERMTDRGLRPDEVHGQRAYEVPLLRFTLAQTEVRGLLMGEKLYEGQSSLAIRELYQNAMDACRYREMRVRYLGGFHRQSAPWTGAIRIETGEDVRGRYVECIDNGVGMTIDQLSNTFTQAGRRFEQSRDFRREQAAWLRHDSSLKLYPNSRFGIGVFSYFMLADEMIIVTRPVGRDGRPAPKALRVEIPGSGSLFRIQEDDSQSGDELPEGGTRVRLYLRNSYTLVGTSCETELRGLLYISEFRLEVRCDLGPTRVWSSGVLQPGPDARPVAAKSAVEAVPGTLWWVEGNGAILCDGISTDRFPFGYVLNLTGPHAGELNVNRKKLEGYDEQWAATLWRQGADALAAWPALDLAWVQKMEDKDLSVARAIWQEWRGRGIRVKSGDGVSVNLDESGWFSLDRSVVGKERNSYDREGIGDALRPWRSMALGSHSRAVKQATPRSLAGYPVPEPGWAVVATDVDGDWRTVVSTAGRLSSTPAAVLRAARGLRLAHPRLAGPAVSQGDLDWKPGYIDSLIMTGLLGQKREHAKGASVSRYRHAARDLSGIVRASVSSSLALGKLAEACARYTPFVGSPLGEVPARHRDHVCDQTDLDLLYIREGEATSRPAVRAWDVPVVADAAALELPEAWRRMADFAWLGRPVPAPEQVMSWAALPSELMTLLRRYVTEEPGGSFVLPWAATLDLAAEWEIPLRKAEKILAREAALLGLAHQRRYATGAAGRGLVPDPVTGALVAQLHDQGLRLESGISLRDVAFVRSYEVSWEETADAVDDLRAAGVEIPDAADLLRAWEEMPHTSRYAFSGIDTFFDAADYPVLATSDVLFVGSRQSQEKLSFLWRTARKEARRLGLGPELLPPDLADGLKGYRPTWEDIHALIDLGEPEKYDEWVESPRWTALTPKRLIDYARARYVGARRAFGLLEPLRAIGALVPELSPEAIAALPEDVPDAYDADALDPEFRVSSPGTPLVPLDLVSIAGRLGESVSSTWQRITPYLSLEPESSPMIGIPDILPLWQDLVILSEGLDGMLPAVQSLVTPERLAFASASVGKSPEWVRNRLEHYSGLFGLELPPMAESEEQL